MFLTLFSIALVACTIYCFKNKKYIYLFVPCYLFLPGYYGISLSDSLPVLNVTRIITVFFYIYVLINKRKTFKEIFFSPFSGRFLLLFGYAAFRILANLFYANGLNIPTKMIFSIIFEQVFIVIAFLLLSPSDNEIKILEKVIVWSAFFLFVIGILESLTSTNIFDQLYTVQRNIPNEHYIRLGLLRATTTMELPGQYSNMCLFILPLALHLYNTTTNKLYLLVCFADILAAIHSGSRSFYFYLLLVMTYYLVFILRSNAQRLRCIKHVLLILLLLVAFASTLSVFSPKYKYFYTGSAKAFLNELGANYDLNADAPSGVDGYGGNYDSTYEFQGGVSSRKLQFTGIVYALNHDWLHGLGTDALSKRLVRYYYNGFWCKTNSIDVGIVEIIMYEGLLGLVGYCFLFIYIFRSVIPQKPMQFRKHYSLLLILSYILTTLSTCNMIPLLLLITLLAIYNYRNPSLFI